MGTKDAAVKFDEGKPRVELLMTGPAFTEIAKALTYGATKYSDYNYAEGKGLDWLRLAGAAGRHLAAWLCGEEKDPESGLHPLSHCGASVVMLLNLILWGKGEDGRHKQDVARELAIAAQKRALDKLVKQGDPCMRCAGPLGYDKFYAVDGIICSQCQYKPVVEALRSRKRCECSGCGGWAEDALGYCRDCPYGGCHE